MTRAVVAELKAEAKRFIAVLDRCDWYGGQDGNGRKVAEYPMHGHTARVKRASLILSQRMADFRRGRME